VSESIPESQEFRRLAELYAQAADGNRPELLDAIMMDDAVIEGPQFRMEGIANIRRIPAMLKEFYLRTRHLVHNQTVVVDGENASGETYGTASHLLKDGAQVLVWHMRYHDSFRKHGEQWRFAKRTLLIDWAETRAVNVSDR
jgi:hypothetical protein